MNRILARAGSAFARGAGRWMALCTLAIVIAGCGSDHPTGSSSDGELREDPGTATMRLTVVVQSPRPVDRVVVDVKPGAVTSTLALDSAQRSFGGELSVAAVNETVTATAYSGKTRVAATSIVVPLVRNTAANLFLRILDTASGWPLSTKGPVITGFYVSPISVLQGSTVQLGARAVDPASAPLSFRWASACAGAFSSVASATTGWVPSSYGTCSVTLQVTSPSGKDVRAGSVMVTPVVADVPVTGRYEAWPFVEEIVIAAGSGTCDVLRTAVDASCRTVVLPGETAMLTTMFVSSGDTRFDWRDDCGGVFALLDATGWPRRVVYTWTSPASYPAGVCTLSAELKGPFTTDTFPVPVPVSATPQ